MRIIPLLAAAAAFNPAVTAKEPCKDLNGALDARGGSLGTGPFIPPLTSGASRSIRNPFASSQDKHHELAARAQAGYATLGTRYNKCLDVKDGNFANGAGVQLWDCNNGSPNQQWKIAGNNLRTSQNKCLDVPWGNAYLGAPVQLWDCDGNNRNQFFEVAGNSIRKKNTNFCLDVRDGRYDNGASLQLWACDWNQGGNQIFNFGQPAQSSVPNPSSFLGYAAISWPEFARLHPECASYGDAINAASQAMGLVPVLLGALAENEASCQERPNNGFGMFQFMDENAWQKFGGPGADKQKASDAIWGGARYMRYLLDYHNQNLDNALRAYNGPVSQGGDPNYQKNIRTWMSGGSTW